MQRPAASSIYIYLALVHRSCSHNPIQDGVGFLLPHFLPRLSNGQPLGLWPPPNRGQTLNTLVIEIHAFLLQALRKNWTIQLIAFTNAFLIIDLLRKNGHFLLPIHA